MATAYFGRDGIRLQKVEWMELRAKIDYYIVAQFDNEKVRVWVEWLGEVRGVENLLPDCYEIFKVRVQNYNERGRLVDDPADDGRTFPTERAAMAFYQDFPLRWSECAITEEGEFEEVGNILTPPPPPDPNKPADDYANNELLGEEGAW